MADLRDREVAVSDKNDSKMGPSGRRARSADSFYFEVGGSSDIYNVTINFKSKNGHWCEKLSGDRCHGNGNGKRKYGPPQGRDKHDPQQWCKHVKAALADTEALAEAQDRTAKAFGLCAPDTTHYAGKMAAAVAAPTVADIAAEKSVEKHFDTPTVTASARERLAAIDAEAAAIRAEVGGKVAALVSEYGSEAVAVALRQNEAA